MNYGLEWRLDILADQLFPSDYNSMDYEWIDFKRADYKCIDYKYMSFKCIDFKQ